MKKMIGWMAAVLVVSVTGALAQDTARRAMAEELLNLMKMQENIEKSFAMVKKMIPEQMKKMEQATGQTNLATEVSSQTDKTMDMVFQELSWDKMKDGYITLYAETFTVEEMKGLIAFYKSPAGQSLIQKQPELMRRSMELSQTAMLKIRPKIEAMTKGHTQAAKGDRNMKLIQGDLSVATNEVERFCALNNAAREALKAGKTEEARTLANELARLAPKHKKDWNYGNAIQVANQVLGRIALAEGNIAEAKERLLASADSKGSPQMNSFGPNMQLASELLAKGERQVVLDYFKRCGTFWEMGAERLAAWTAAVKKGETPNFGANLEY